MRRDPPTIFVVVFDAVVIADITRLACLLRILWINQSILLSFLFPHHLRERDGSRINVELRFLPSVNGFAIVKIISIF